MCTMNDVIQVYVCMLYMLSCMYNLYDFHAYIILYYVYNVSFLWRIDRWITFTMSHSQTWTTKIKPFFRQGNHIFINIVNSNVIFIKTVRSVSIWRDNIFKILLCVFYLWVLLLSLSEMYVYYNTLSLMLLKFCNACMLHTELDYTVHT